MSIVVGARACGWRGSIAASLGLVGAPVIIVITLGMLYSRFGGLETVRNALIGLGASASGLIVATAARMAEPLLRESPVARRAVHRHRVRGRGHPALPAAVRVDRARPDQHRRGLVLEEEPRVKTSDTLVALAVQFTSLSLVAFGGANAVIPEMHRQAVDVNHWMTNQDFAALFAIAQAAPGPNFLVTTLIGWKAAGLAGALVATAAMCGPSCVLDVLGGKGVGPAPRDRLALGHRRRSGAGDRGLCLLQRLRARARR